MGALIELVSAFPRIPGAAPTPICEWRSSERTKWSSSGCGESANATRRGRTDNAWSHPLSGDVDLLNMALDVHREACGEDSSNETVLQEDIDSLEDLRARPERGVDEKMGFRSGDEALIHGAARSGKKGGWSVTQITRDALNSTDLMRLPKEDLGASKASQMDMPSSVNATRSSLSTAAAHPSAEGSDSRYLPHSRKLWNAHQLM